MKISLPFNNNNALEKATTDYLYLLNRNYPVKASINIVGNRYNLDKKCREILKRGIYPDKISLKRKNKIVENSKMKNKCVFVDTYNVVTVISSVMRGLPAFYCSDGVVRDISGLYDENKKNQNFNQILKMLNSYFFKYTPKQIIFVLDKGVSKSGQTANNIRTNFNYKVFHVTLEKNADKFLSEKSFVITADSVIIDEVEGIFDTAGTIIQNALKLKIPAIIE